MCPPEKKGGFLSGTPVLVTGAGKRIGAAIAEALADRGAPVVLHYGQSSQEAEALCERIVRHGGRVATVQADLNQPEQVMRLIERAAGCFGPLGVLINNAALFHPGHFSDTSLAQWQHHLAVNLTAPFLLMQAFAQQSTPHQTGKILNLLDQRIARPRPGHLAYNATKSALWTLTQIAAQELAPHIQVNAIAPGPILPASGEGSEASFLAVARKTPLQRPGGPEDILQAVLYLLRQNYVTGEILRVDGGEHLV